MSEQTAYYTITEIATDLNIGRAIIDRLIHEGFIRNVVTRGLRLKMVPADEFEKLRQFLQQSPEEQLVSLKGTGYALSVTAAKMLGISLHHFYEIRKKRRSFPKPEGIILGGHHYYDVGKIIKFAEKNNMWYDKPMADFLTSGIVGIEAAIERQQ